MSCQRNKKENPTIIKRIENVEKNVEQKLASYCFFKLDDKYSIEEDNLIINTWLKEKSQVLLKNDSIPNIFSQNGGGPNGAQWNPSTDLYIAILTHYKESTEIPKLYINEKLYKKQVYPFSSHLIWYEVKQSFWEQEVKEIDSSDIQKMYPSEFLNGISAGEFNPVADLKYGKILKFEISYKKEKLTKFFHATYGE
ncbi:hypothetical protein GCM10007384_38430 [Aquimarina muelleri]|uniref:Uncharacterized protein n=2 Tax=Aquimarina muelleri TaxID=279356 RepID=A0A918JZN2_9FLAO|nr:hypothetical protein GCM10007384_38430 [Aquimarina muelleri]